MTIYDAAFDANGQNKRWLNLFGATDNAYRVVVRGGVQMFVRRSELQAGDRIMAWDLDIAGAQKGVWRTQAAVLPFSFEDVGAWDVGHLPPLDHIAWDGTKLVAGNNPVSGRQITAADVGKRFRVTGAGFENHNIAPSVSSVAVNPPPSATNSAWELIMTPAWDMAASYSAGDYVSVMSTTILRAKIAVPAGTNITPLEPHWEQLFTQDSPPPSFDSMAAYAVGAHVQHGGSLWRAVSIINEPSGWENMTVERAWDGRSSYAAQAYAVHNNILYRAIGEIMTPAANASPDAGLNPSPPNASWGAVTVAAWTGTAGYAANAVVTHLGVSYVALNAIPAPSTWGNSSVWNNTNTFGSTSGEAHIVSGTVVLVNATPSSGAATELTAGQAVRVRLTGNSIINDTSVETTIAGVQFPSSRFAYTFTDDVGISNASGGQGGGVLTIDRQITPVPNPAPASDTTNWAVVPAWSATAAYDMGATVLVGTTAYRSNAAITAPTNVSWTQETTTPFVNTAAYPANTLVQAGDRFYRARNNISANSGTYVQAGVWNIGDIVGTATDQPNIGELVSGSLVLSLTPVSGSAEFNLNEQVRLVIAGSTHAFNINGTYNSSVSHLQKSGSAQEDLFVTLQFFPSLPSALTNVNSGGGTITIQRQTFNLSPPDDPTNWELLPLWNGQSAYAIGDRASISHATPSLSRLFRATATVSVPMNAAPPDDAANWSASTPQNWSPTTAYNAHTVVNENGTFFITSIPVAAPPVSTFNQFFEGVLSNFSLVDTGGVSFNVAGDAAFFGSNPVTSSGGSGTATITITKELRFVPFATWNSGSSTNADEADYYGGPDNAGDFAASLFVNTNPLTGNPNDLNNNVTPSGRFRLRAVGVGPVSLVSFGTPVPGTLNGEIIGTISNWRTQGGRRAFAIQSPAAMRTEFGPTQTGGSNGVGVWHLEKEDTS